MLSNLRRHAFTICQFIVRVCHQFGTFQQKGRFHEIGRFQSEWEIPSSEAALFVGDKYTLCVDGFRGPRPVGFGRATASQRAVTLKLQLNPPSMNLVRPPEMLASLNDGAIGPEKKKRIKVLTSAAKPLKRESGNAARRRRLQVLQLLKDFNKPQLWHHVSALVVNDWKLDISNVIKTKDVANLEWLLTSGVANDIRELEVGGEFAYVSEVDTFKDVATVRTLCAGICFLPTLTQLIMWRCQLTDEGFAVVARTVVNCHQLELLLCRFNDIGDESERTVTTLMEEMTGLTLRLHGCRLTTAVAERLATRFGERLESGFLKMETDAAPESADSCRIIRPESGTTTFGTNLRADLGSRRQRDRILRCY
ncbi:hypothetical protein NP493_3007g00000 [Ridgeia piscesae]|uniref:Uncharacterized protein n=1 Tax=Ridgeia piscesae TaxID=27915 RepID=A0AAD9JA33_RIDPI|nr:hypothetical protein NP493_3007g00000 [Ridgeia piscesae]